MVVVAAVACVLCGLLLFFAGLLRFTQATSFGILLFLLPALGLLFWRIKPLNEASRLLDEGKFPAAQFVIESYLSNPALRAGRAWRRALLLHAHVLWYLEDAEAAQQVADQLLEQTSDKDLQLLLLNFRVACFVKLRQTLKIHGAMNQVLRMDGITPSQKSESQLSAGICAMNEEMFHDAIDFFQAAARDCPDDGRKAYIFGMLAHCYNRVKDYVKALGAVQDAKKTMGEDKLTQALALDNFAFAKANLKQDLPEALAAAEEGLALGVDAAIPHLHMSRGEVHYALRDFDKALADLEECLRRLPDRDKNSRQKAWFIKGKIHKARGEDDLAKEALSEAISIDSSKTIAMNAQAVMASPEALNTLIESGDVKLET